MGTRLLCWAVLCLLGAGEFLEKQRLHFCISLGIFLIISSLKPPYSFSTVLSEAGVTQSPRYVIIRERQEVSFWCDPISGHNTLYWYLQPRDQGLQSLVYFQNEAVMDDSQLPKDRFSAVRPDGVNSTLKIQSAKLEDSATYLCASSLATVVQRPLPAVHKTDGFPQASIQQRPLLASHTP